MGAYRHAEVGWYIGYPHSEGNSGGLSSMDGLFWVIVGVIYVAILGVVFLVHALMPKEKIEALTDEELAQFFEESRNSR